VDCMGHGTFVASEITGTKYGVAKSAKVIPLRIFSCSGSSSASIGLQAIYWIINNKPADQKCIVNMSWGSSFNALSNKAVRDLVSAGCVVVASAGNSAANVDNYSPASEPSILAIGAIDKNNKIAYYSNEGSLDLFAPGSDILGLGIHNNVMVYSGTSMASPIVAGICAQIWEKFPNMTNVQVMQYVVDNAQEGILSEFKMDSSPNLSARVPKSSDSGGPVLRTPCKKYGRRTCAKRPRCRWLFNKKYCTER
jgi:subtilisin family serine protease